MTDSYLEQLRKPVKSFKTRNGSCFLCSARETHLERHHESYYPERVCFICHKCHYKITFTFWKLTNTEKEKLLTVRYGKSLTAVALEKGVTVDALIKGYSPPRRPSSFKKQRIWKVPN